MTGRMTPPQRTRAAAPSPLQLPTADIKQHGSCLQGCAYCACTLTRPALPFSRNRSLSWLKPYVTWSTWCAARGCTAPERASTSMQIGSMQAARFAPHVCVPPPPPPSLFLAGVHRCPSPTDWKAARRCGRGEGSVQPTAGGGGVAPRSGLACAAARPFLPQQQQEPTAASTYPSPGRVQTPPLRSHAPDTGLPAAVPPVVQRPAQRGLPDHLQRSRGVGGLPGAVHAAARPL